MTRAMRLPSSTNSSMRVERIFTRANSPATKKPLAAMRTRTTTMPMIALIVTDEVSFSRVLERGLTPLSPLHQELDVLTHCKGKRPLPIHPHSILQDEPGENM